MKSFLSICFMLVRINHRNEVVIVVAVVFLLFFFGGGRVGWTKVYYFANAPALRKRVKETDWDLLKFDTRGKCSFPRSKLRPASCTTAWLSGLDFRKETNNRPLKNMLKPVIANILKSNFWNIKKQVPSWGFLFRHLNRN